MSLLTRRLLCKNKKDIADKVWGIRNGSFESWTNQEIPDEWILTTTATGFGWLKNTTASYVSDGLYSLHVYKNTATLSGTVSLKQEKISVDTSLYTKVMFDLKRVAFSVTGYDQDIYFSAGIRSDSLGSLVTVSHNWYYGISSSKIPTSVTLTIPTSARNKTLNDVSVWMDFNLDVSAAKYTGIICIIDNVRFA